MGGKTILQFTELKHKLDTRHREEGQQRVGNYNII